MPVLFHSIALALAFNVQTMLSWTAFATVFFFGAGCWALQQDIWLGIQEYWYALHFLQGPRYKTNPVWYLCGAWFMCLTFSALVLHIYPAALTLGASLAFAPALARLLPPHRLPQYTWGFGIVIVLYALELYPQEIWQTHYTNFNTEGNNGRSWPLLDPNSAAAAINFALLPAFYIMLRDKQLRWKLLFAVLLVALGITHSKAGMGCAGIGMLILASAQFGKTILGWGAATALIGFPYCQSFHPAMMQRAWDALAERFPIWQASVKLLSLAPWTGTGIGTFGLYYPSVRTEQYTAGFFAHNDLLQFGIELGWPVTLLFCGLVAAVALTTRRENIVAAVAMLCALLQAMVEFQLYVPVISVLMGLALAFHIHGYHLHRKRQWALSSGRTF